MASPHYGDSICIPRASAKTLVFQINVSHLFEGSFVRSQNLSNSPKNFGQGRKKAGDLADLDTMMVTMVPHTWGNTIVPRSPY